MAVKAKFTRIPKVRDLVQQGVPAEVIPTYCALADHSNNKTGLCWPKMETIALTLNRSVRTVQRHLHLLKEKGLIEFVTRRRFQGKFSSYTYRICFIATTGHQKRMAGAGPNKRRTKQSLNTSQPPKKDIKEGYWWFFGEKAPPGRQEELDRQAQEKREEEARRRSDGYEWLFA